MDAKTLRKILVDNGISQRSMARVIGIDERTMRRYVGDESKIPKTVELSIQWAIGNMSGTIK